MKNILLKYGLILTVLLFIDYVVIAIFGCASCLLGAEEQYFCETYCWVVRSFIGLGLLVYLGYLIHAIYKHYKLNGAE